MNQEKEDFMTKLQNIEREATAIFDAVAPTDLAMRARAMHIATTAKLLRARMDVAAPLILQPEADINSLTGSYGKA